MKKATSTSTATVKVVLPGKQAQNSAGRAKNQADKVAQVVNKLEADPDGNVEDSQQVEPVGISTVPRKRERLNDNNIEGIRILWRKGATYEIIEQVTGWSAPTIAKYTKGIPQGMKDEPPADSPGAKSIAEVPVVPLAQVKMDPLVAETKPPPQPQSKSMILPVGPSPEAEAAGVNNGEANNGENAKRWSQDFRVTMDPNVILLIMSDSMDEGYDNDLDGYFKKYVFPSLRQLRILKNSMPPVPEKDFLTAVQLMMQDAIVLRKMKKNAQAESDAKTVQMLGGNPDALKKFEELKSLGA